MPACFTLTRKGLSSPAPLNEVDRAICQHLEMPMDDVKYVHRWYDWIGLGLAIGYSWAQIGEIFRDCPELLQINQFLQENYTPDNWVEVGRYR